MLYIWLPFCPLLNISTNTIYIYIYYSQVFVEYSRIYEIRGNSWKIEFAVYAQSINRQYVAQSWNLWPSAVSDTNFISIWIGGIGIWYTYIYYINHYRCTICVGDVRMPFFFNLYRWYGNWYRNIIEQ